MERNFPAGMPKALCALCALLLSCLVCTQAEARICFLPFGCDGDVKCRGYNLTQNKGEGWTCASCVADNGKTYWKCLPKPCSAGGYETSDGGDSCTDGVHYYYESLRYGERTCWEYKNNACEVGCNAAGTDCLPCDDKYPQSDNWYSGNNRPTGCYDVKDTATCNGIPYTQYEPMSTTCDDGYRWDASQCRCVDASCESPYSTQYQSVNDCGNYAQNGSGWRWEYSGMSGTQYCGRCISEDCSQGTTNPSSCDRNDGWNYKCDLNGKYSGDTQCCDCARDTPKECPARYNNVPENGASCSTLDDKTRYCSSSGYLTGDNYCCSCDTRECSTSGYYTEEQAKSDDFKEYECTPVASGVYGPDPDGLGCYDCERCTSKYSQSNGWYDREQYKDGPEGCYEEGQTVTCGSRTYTHWSRMSTSCPDGEEWLEKNEFGGKRECRCVADTTYGCYDCKDTEYCRIVRVTWSSCNDTSYSHYEGVCEDIGEVKTGSISGVGSVIYGDLTGKPIDLGDPVLDPYSGQALDVSETVTWWTERNWCRKQGATLVPQDELISHSNDFYKLLNVKWVFAGDDSGVSQDSCNAPGVNLEAESKDGKNVSTSAPRHFPLDKNKTVVCKK